MGGTSRELAQYAASAAAVGSVLDEEDGAIATARRVVRPVAEVRFQARLDAAARARRGPQHCVFCDAVAPSQGLRSRTVASSLGPLRLRRAYCYCADCGVGAFPDEKAIGLTDNRFTPRLAESVTQLSTVLPFQVATQMCASLIGVEVSVHGAEILVEQRGAAVSLLRCAELKDLRPHDADGGARKIVRPPDACDKAPDVAYFEADGVYVMVRELDQQRSQPAPLGARGGRGRRYELGGREVKNGILYTGDKCVQLSNERGCLLDKTYVSHLGTWQAFAARVWREMQRQRFDQAGTRVVISDGAEWIRSLCDWLPFNVIQILDLFHVKKRIHEVSSALHPDDELARRRWSAVQCDRAESARHTELLEAFDQARPRGDNARKLLSEVKTYISNNLDRMDYPAYRAAGLRVGSGAVESTNFHITGNRLKLQGMRWSEIGAADMAVLRTDLFNGRWRRTTEQLLAA